MGFLSSLVGAIGESVEKTFEESVSNVTGVNVKREVVEIDREIQSLKRELEKLQEEKNEYSESEYRSYERDIKSEIWLCKKAKVEIIKGIVDEHNENLTQEYYEKLEGVSTERLEKIVSNSSFPEALRRAAQARLESNYY